MICPKCGAAIHDNAAFCEYCGYAIPAQTNPAAYQQPVQQNYQQDYQQTYQQAYQQPVQQAYQQPQAPYANAVEIQKENVILGTIGALLGSLLGGLSIFLFYMMEMVASFSGVVMAFCTLMGYQLLGKKLSTKGIIICVVIMLVMTFVAFELSQGIIINKELDIGISESLDMMHTMMDYDEELKGLYYKDLAMQYLFCAIGAVGIIISKAKGR